MPDCKPTVYSYAYLFNCMTVGQALGPVHMHTFTYVCSMSKVCHVNGPQIYIRKQIEMMEKLKGADCFRLVSLSVRASVRPSVRPCVRYKIY